MSPKQRPRRARGNLPHVLWLVFASVVICASLMWRGALQPAAAGWLDEKHADICRNHRGTNYTSFTTRLVSDPSKCTEGCFRYQLFCQDGTRTFLTSRYPPDVGDLTIFFYENGGLGFLVKLLIFAPVGFFAFVSTFGSKESFERLALQNAAIAGLFAVTLLVWGAGNMGEGEWSLARPLD
jgi:hypothetical protein